MVLSPTTGSRPAAAKRLTLALTSTYFCLGFCNTIKSATYVILYPGITSWTLTWLSVASIFGLFVGALLPWPLSNFFKIGRKPCALIGLGLYGVGVILATAVFALSQLYVSLVFYGLGAGVLSVVGILWRVETAPAVRRGRDAVLLGIAVAAGSATASWIEYGFDYVGDTVVSIRVPLALQIALVIVAVVLVWRADESWRWLLQHNQADKARDLLARLLLTPQSAPEFSSAFAALVHHTHQTSTSCTLFVSKRTTQSSPQLRVYRRLLLACALQTMRALSGISAANWYVNISSSAVTGWRDGFALSAATPTIVLLFSLLPYFLIDKPAFSIFTPAGRRNLLTYSALGMFAIFLLATIVTAATGSFSLSMWPSGTGIDTGLLTGYWVLFLFANLFFELGFHSVTDLYTAEIAASHVSTETVSIANAWSMAVEVGLAWGVGYGVTGLGPYFFLLWMGLNLVWMVAIFLFYPETQSRNLEMLDGLFAGGLKGLADLDGEARSGKNIGHGIAEFGGLSQSFDAHWPGAELVNSSDGSQTNERSGWGATGRNK